VWGFRRTRAHRSVAYDEWTPRSIVGQRAEKEIDRMTAPNRSWIVLIAAWMFAGCTFDDVGGAGGALGVCADGLCAVAINEVESNGGTPGDWVELINLDTTPADISGWHFRDNDDTHDYVLPAGTIIAAGGRLVLDEGSFGFGLGGADSARIFDTTGALVDSHAWTSHAPTTYGRCADGSGAFIANATSTKGAANDCAVLVINEIESNGGTPGDWVELLNRGPVAIDLGGYVFRDNDDTHSYTIPAGTTLAPGAYLTLEEAQFDFGLGGADSARIFTPALAIADAHAWTAHASTTYGRCPNGTGTFATSTTITKGAVNECGPPPPPLPAWPGRNDVQVIDGTDVFGGDMSDLYYEAGTLYAAQNGSGRLYTNVPSGSIWAPSAAQTLRYPNGMGSPDAEGVTSADGAFYVATERDNDNNGVSRMSVLRFEPGSGDLVATHEWNLNADLPVSGANVGLEAITYLPDSFLVANGFYDEAAAGAYDPSRYPNHGAGLFVVGHEGTGRAFVYALDHVSGGFVRVASFSSGFTVSKALYLDRETGYLWSACGAPCNNQVSVFAIDLDPASSTRGRFVALNRYAGPSTMPNLQNEGIAIAPESECVGGQKPFFWSDDAETNGHALRADTIPCGPFLDDVDRDGVRDRLDNCAAVSNPTQSDGDGDGQGDGCDVCPADALNDADGDGHCADRDNCNGSPNDQTDSDADGFGDACDVCVLDPANDADGDGSCGDVDNCPSAANENQADSDLDGIGDECDADDDGDGVEDTADNCPMTANTDQADRDGDGGGDACDSDDDQDGVPDDVDACPATAPGAAHDSAGCSIDDRVPCSLPAPARWKSHGAYLVAYLRAVHSFLSARLITRREAAALTVRAARSRCGARGGWR
jgi:hypothetical protein